jgi:hypothetical protein
LVALLALHRSHVDLYQRFLENYSRWNQRVWFPHFMELFLNLAWLLLALPAFWLWRDAGNTRVRYKFSSLQCLLALGCVLVMLFPVISATDDLHAMRSEMEESPASKRSVRQAGHDKASVWNSRLQSPPAVLPKLFSFALANEYKALPPAQSFSILTPPSSFTSTRAPPRFA